MLDKFTIYREERKVNWQLQICIIKTPRAHIEGASIPVLEDEGSFWEGVKWWEMSTFQSRVNGNALLALFLDIMWKYLRSWDKSCLFLRFLFLVFAWAQATSLILPCRLKGWEVTENSEGCIWLNFLCIEQGQVATYVISECNQKLFKTCYFHKWKSSPGFMTIAPEW